MDYDFECDLHAIADELDAEVAAYEARHPAHVECAVNHYLDTVHAGHVNAYWNQQDIPF
jgi:hypothetical protein